MRVASLIVLATICAGCSGGSSQGKRAMDGSSDIAAPVPFVPYTPPPIEPPRPPIEPPPVPPASGEGGAGGVIGAAGMAGPDTPAAGQGGQGGLADLDGGFQMPPPPPPPPPFCDGMMHRPLPYAIASDFTSRLVLHPDLLTLIEPPNCNQPVFPDAAPTSPFPIDAGLPGANDPVTTATSCFEVKYHPDDCLDLGGACWAGVIFTASPIGPNGPGICIEPGATVVHFKARASKDNARVKFGSIREGQGSTEFFLQLTRVWRSYTVTIPAGEDYNNEITNPGGVWNGFSVVVEPQDHAGATYILVADVIWARS